jgi:hypothetical protein
MFALEKKAWPSLPLYRIENRIAAHPGIPDVLMFYNGRPYFIENKVAHFTVNSKGKFKGVAVADMSHWRDSQRVFFSHGYPDTYLMISTYGVDKSLYFVKGAELQRLWDYAEPCRHLKLTELAKFRKLGDRRSQEFTSSDVPIYREALNFLDSEPALC